jgi:hypothetical protein
MKNPEELKKLVKEQFAGYPGVFRPCAWFDERLDCIRVVARDCSILEKRLSDRLTILEDSYYPRLGHAKVVGFTIKGARYFCHQQGWDLNTPISMTKVLDAIVAQFPGEVVRFFVDYVARPLVTEENIEEVEICSGVAA